MNKLSARTELTRPFLPAKDFELSKRFKEGLRTPKTKNETGPIKDGDACVVIGGTHNGKSGKATDLNISKTGNLTLTVSRDNGERFKTLGKSVVASLKR